MRLGETGPIGLSGDLYHFAVSRERRRMPPFNSDADLTTSSMRRVDSLLEETQATFGLSTSWRTSRGRSTRRSTYRVTSTTSRLSRTSRAR